MTVLDADQEEEEEEEEEEEARARAARRGSAAVGGSSHAGRDRSARRRAPLARSREHDEHAERLVGAEAVVGAGGDEDGVALDERRLLALDVEDAVPSSTM